ncbi:MAG: CatB-related O-acetyltransferase [Pseudobdellovibrio sp.]
MKNTFLFGYKFIIRNLKLDLLIFKASWRLKNKNNKTIPVNIFKADLVSVDKMSYGPLIVHMSGASGERLTIGSYVSVSYGVKFILGGNHNTNTFTTFPHKYMTWGLGVEATSKGPIVIQDDVWIGTDSIILSGVTLGKGCIVAAGSIVTKSVPAFAVVGGNPAKIIKYRFNEDIMSRMMKIDFSEIDWNGLSDAQELFYTQLNNITLDKIDKVIK